MMGEEDIKEVSEQELESAFPDNAFKAYMNEINKYPPLSVDEQISLGRKMINGDETAREKLVKSTLKLVVWVAFKYYHTLKHMTILDIIQEGNIGLLKAVERYNPEEGAFTTYATRWIKQSITKGIHDKNDEVRKPVHLQESINKYNKLMQSLKARGKIISDEEICEILNIDLKKLALIRETMQNTATVSMHAKIEDDKDGTELSAFIESDSTKQYNDIINQMVDHDLFVILKNVLKPLHYYILYHRVLAGEHLTLEVIGEEFHVTRERIRQIEAKTLRIVKPYLDWDSEYNRDLLNKIKIREGVKYPYIKEEPTSPKDVIRYLFLKDHLSIEERELYKLRFLSNYKYSFKTIAHIMNISEDYLTSLNKSLQSKIAYYLKDLKHYKLFEKDMMQKYSTKILAIDVDKIDDTILYRSLEDKYANLTYDEFLRIYNDSGISLDNHDLELIKRFYNAHLDHSFAMKNDVEKDINLPRFGFVKKDGLVPLSKLYKTYLQSKDEYRPDQQLYLECFFFNRKPKELFYEKYPDSPLLENDFHLIARVERRYFHIYSLLESSLSKEEWLDVKSTYPELFTPFRIEILDRYFGVYGKPIPIIELYKNYDMEYNEFHDAIFGARNLAIALKAGIKHKIKIDKSLYIPYLESPYYKFSEPSNTILRRFIIENKGYDEIAKEVGLTRTQVSNAITNGIRKMDNYRFGLTDIFIVSKEEVEEVIRIYKKRFSDLDIKFIMERYINLKDVDEITKMYHVDNRSVNDVITKFNKLYKDLKIKDVEVSIEEIEREVALPPCESVYSIREKIHASFYYGFKNSYNKEGIKLTSEEIQQLLKITPHVYYHLRKQEISNLKMRKSGLLKPSDCYISRSKMAELLSDVHLPISDKERDIISYFYGLNGREFLSFKELTKIFGDTEGSIRRRYQRAIVNIFKYMNNEIPGKIDYENDIVPILKYFATKDREKVIDFYRDNLSYEEIAKKYSLTFRAVVGIMTRIKVNVYDILNNPEAKKFDFDYYKEAIKDERLPFYGNLKEATQILELSLGMRDEERLTFPQIKERLNIEMSVSSMSQVVSFLMLAVCKLRIGIYKEKTYPSKRVEDYYNLHFKDMGAVEKKVYEKYLKYQKDHKKRNKRTHRIPGLILNDLIKEDYPDAFRYESATREEVLEILKNPNLNLSSRIRRQLMFHFNIPERIFMKGKELSHIYRIFNQIESIIRNRGEERTLNIK